MSHTLRRGLIAAMGTAALLGVAAGPASAASPIDREHFHDQGSDEWGCWTVPPEGPEETWPDPDYVLDYSFDVSGSSAFQVRGQSTGPGFHDAVRGTETWTFTNDTETTADDHTLTHTFANNVRDAEVVVESTGADGTLLLTVSASGNDTFWLDGERLRDPGHVVFQFRLHHNGTLLDPSDDFGFEFLGFLQESTGLNEADDIDLDPCALADL